MIKYQCTFRKDIKNNQSIDFLKGICIFFVVLTHFSWTSQERLLFAFPFWIDMAIPIFMLITGYVNTLSYKRKNVKNLSDAFSINNWLKSFLRYTIPYLIIFLLEAIIQIILSATSINTKVWYDYILGFLTGGWGPGSYYYPILLQFLIIFPFIFKLVTKYGSRGLVCSFLINLIWECLKTLIGISSACYRLLIFRYIFLISFGCYTAIYGLKNKKVNIVSIVAAGIGAIFLIITQYTSYNPAIFTYWTTTCLIAILFVIPFFNAFILNDRNFSKAFKPILFIGKASYNISLCKWYIIIFLL